MRLPPVLAALCLTFTLTAASSPWGAFVERRKGLDPRMARWTLCVRTGEMPTFDKTYDEIFVKLLQGGDLAIEVLGTAEAQDLWSQKSWDDRPHWALLSPGGELVSGAAGQVSGEALLDAIHAAGGLPRWEVREAFLREHPEQGEARLEAVGQAFRLMRARLLAWDRQGKIRVPAWHQEANAPQRFPFSRVGLPPTPEGEAQAEELFDETAKALVELFKVPGWQREASAVSAQLMFTDVSQSASMRRLFQEIATQAEQNFHQDPYSYDLANFWMEAREASGKAPELLGGNHTAVPGRSWPTPAILNRLGEPYRRRMDWGGALKYLGDLTPQSCPEPLTPWAWEEYSRLLCAIYVQQSLALAGQGSWDLAATALENARQTGGGQGVREAMLMRGGQWAGSPSDLAAWRNLLNQALTKDGAKPPMPPAAPPMRLVLMGNPKWILDWSELHHAPELALWSPAELRWEAVAGEAQTRLRRQFHWGPGPRWVLLRGEDLLFTGETCPKAAALASLLDVQGPALLQRFQDVLMGQPDHLAAHAARFALLLPRMPDPRLEATLAEDAAAARVLLPFEPSAPGASRVTSTSWKPNAELWGEAAQRVLPKIEEELRCWPSRGALWNLWISWARFHPNQPSILTLAQSLPYWSPQGDWRTGLPYAVQRAVAAELRRQGSFDAMRAWFRVAWDALDRRPLASLRYGERSWVQQRRKEEETAIFQPLRDALSALGCTQEQAELERSFGAMVGREAGRR